MERDGERSAGPHRSAEGAARPASPLDRGLLQTLQKAYHVELTFTSNAIGGNTLTLRETGITR